MDREDIYLASEVTAEFFQAGVALGNALKENKDLKDELTRLEAQTPPWSAP